jgi:pimeloyl-ACP methyl ester carboxylesterase
MPGLVLPSSPLAGGGPVSLTYRRQGQGPALVFLHGGWGYDIYPIDTEAFTVTHTVVIPDRSGYGGSSPLVSFPEDFHYCAALETLAVLDSLGVEQAVWWGHSDGAVIAATAAIHAPHRVKGVILEATHFYAGKPRSRSFFERMAFDPDSFSATIRRTLAAEHGEDQWRTIVRLDGLAWLDLARNASAPSSNLYGDRLSAVRIPALVVHGGHDPRSEPGELEAILGALPQARLSFHPDAGHCPHAEESKDAVTDAVAEFLAILAGDGGRG